MIPADGSHYVHYENNPSGPITRPVIAWDDEGQPLVTGKRGLVPAYELGAVKHIRQTTPPSSPQYQAVDGSSTAPTTTATPGRRPSSRGRSGLMATRCR